MTLRDVNSHLPFTTRYKPDCCSLAHSSRPKPYIYCWGALKLLERSVNLHVESEGLYGHLHRHIYTERRLQMNVRTRGSLPPSTLRSEVADRRTDTQHLASKRHKKTPQYFTPCMSDFPKRSAFDVRRQADLDLGVGVRRRWGNALRRAVIRTQQRSLKSGWAS